MLCNICNTLSRSTTRCNTTLFSNFQHCAHNDLQHSVTFRNALYHSAMLCSTVQCSSTFFINISVKTLQRLASFLINIVYKFLYINIHSIHIFPSKQFSGHHLSRDGLCQKVHKIIHLSGIGVDGISLRLPTVGGEKR